MKLCVMALHLEMAQQHASSLDPVLRESTTCLLPQRHLLTCQPSRSNGLAKDNINVRNAGTNSTVENYLTNSKLPCLLVLLVLWPDTVKSTTELV